MSERRVEIPEYIHGLKPYRPGKPITELAREKGLTRIVKLASNENPLGPSPKAMEAVEQALSETHRYCDPAAYELVAAISRRFNRLPQEIITGHGSDSLIGYLIMAFSDVGDEVLTSEGTFIGIYVNAHKLGRKLTRVPLNDYTYDLSALAAAVTERTKIVYLANPNNPTGSMFTRQEFENFIDKVPGNVLVVLDEAYAEFAAADPEYPDGLSFERDNLLVLRTLSKAYGLGGLRVGFAVGPENLIAQLYKVKLPFEPNNLAQAAGIGALSDESFVERTIAVTRKSLQCLHDAFERLGIRSVPTAANFWLLVLPSREFAADFFAESLNHGLIVRHVEPFGIPEGIRINAGTEDETAFAIDIIEKVYPALCKKYNVEQLVTSN